MHVVTASTDEREALHRLSTLDRFLPLWIALDDLLGTLDAEAARPGQGDT